MSRTLTKKEKTVNIYKAVSAALVAPQFDLIDRVFITREAYNTGHHLIIFCDGDRDVADEDGDWYTFTTDDLRGTDWKPLESIP